VSWVKVVLGLLLLVVAARQFRGRPKDGQQAHLPKWMATVADAISGLTAWPPVHPSRVTPAAHTRKTILPAGLESGE
jgi:hypothetical protein